jgi:hypothetical protein
MFVAEANTSCPATCRNSCIMIGSSNHYKCQAFCAKELVVQMFLILDYRTWASFLSSSDNDQSIFVASPESVSLLSISILMHASNPRSAVSRKRFIF